MPTNLSRKIISLSILIFMFLTGSYISHAQSVEELKNKIEAGNDTIKKLEKEIQGYQKEIEAIGKEKASLSSTLKELDISRKKLEADTKITESKIATKNLEIKQLSLEIGDKSERITDGHRVIAQSFRAMGQANALSPLEIILSSASLSELWNTSHELDTLQGNMQGKIEDLKNIKTDLEKNKKLTEQKKAELVDLTNDLKNQTSVIKETVRQKNTLLAETKNTEADYKKLLANKLLQKEAFEREVASFESALKIAIDPNSIPSTGTGVLKWPLSSIRITQYFGNTEFATKNPQIYNGKGHTGVDFAASIGTPVQAALSGTVIGVGNTDIVRGCYSYGKWVMIKHPNGLSTLYAHLSLQKVVQGQEVSTGDMIGYSGNTGYSTGPHLHFGVYASEGVRITKLTSSVNCKNVTIPLADIKAYLNPLSFL